MNIGISNPASAYNGETNFNSLYALTRGEVNELLIELNTSNFIDNIQLLFSAPVENVVNLICLPFDAKALLPIASQTVDGNILVNVVQMTTKGAYINPETIPYLNLGAYAFAEAESFLDYSPYTTYEIYLPFIGFVTLDNNDILGKTLNIKYVVDYMTGRFTAYLTVNTTSDDERIIAQRDGNMGIVVQIGGGASAEIARNMLKIGATATAGVALAGTAVGASAVATSSTISAVTGTQIHIDRGSASVANSAFYGAQNVFIIKTTQKVERPAVYNSLYGRPSEATAQLESLSGYTEVDKIKLENFGTSTAPELAEIERLLKDGVIL